MAAPKQSFLKGFGERLQHLRKTTTELSQEELADKAKIHRTYMGRIEQGKSNPPAYTIHKILKALGAKASELFQ